MTKANMSDKLQREWPAKLAIADAGVANFGEALRQETANEDEYLRASIDSYLSLLQRGGKRTRGILAVVGYELYGGTETDVIATAAGVVEAHHAYLLVMDDVADESVLRRGGPAAHIFMRDFLVQKHVNGNAAKLGIDAAQSAALVAQHKAQSVFLEIEGVSADRKLMAATLLNDHLARTGVGQVLDMLAVCRSDVTERDIIKIATYKTAYYSFLLPLQVGAALAGASAEELGNFTDYAANAGLAFQLQDDIIGLFGDESVTGKSRMDDVAEGKRTFLMTAALARASAEDKEFLQNLLGSADITESDFARCLEIVKNTGALQQTQARVAQYADQALESLKNAPANWPADKIQFLRDLALYCAHRAS